MLAALLLVVASAGAPPAAAVPSAQKNTGPRSAAAAGATSAPAADRPAAHAEHPDAALLEYLGEFDDAADGLDAMGLEESTRSDARPERDAPAGGGGMR